MDGGDHWGLLETSTDSWLYDIWFSSPGYGWVAGSGGTLMYTDDGGSSWHNILFTNEDLFALSFTDDDNGWVVGNSGNILHTGNGGAAGTVPWGHQAAADAGPLYLYPNPFSVQVSIEIPTSAHGQVVLKVYDRVGREYFAQSMVKDQEGSFTFILPTENFTDGLYHFVLFTAKGKYTAKAMRMGK